MEINEVKKEMEPLSKFSRLIENCRKILHRKNSTERKNISKCEKRCSFFENTINEKEIYPKKMV